jgi:hypothetical protein
LVRGRRGLAGVKVTLAPEQATNPPPTPLRVKTPEVRIVEQFIPSLKVAVSTWEKGTLTAPFMGTVEVTIGGSSVVKVQT